jgi:hypothetical protein
MTRRWIFACALAAIASHACSPEPREGIEGVGDLGDGGADAAQADADGRDREPSAFGVVSGDYTVSSIALLAPDGALLDADFIDSGSATAGLVTALSGDVVLATNSGERGVMTLLDRYRSNVITRVDVANGVVLGQVKTQAENDGADENGYSSNPQDYVQIDAGTAWVSRYEPNLTAAADDLDKGLDLLRIDPRAFERGDERVDFGVFNGKGERTNGDSGETERVTVYARPARIVRLGDHLVVGLESLSQTFDAAGKGMVALVDLSSKKVAKLELPGLQSCGQVVPVPDDRTRAAVACTGVYFGDAPTTAGLAMLHLEGGALSIEHIWRAADDEGAAVTRYGLVALSATEVVAVAAGQSEVKRGGKVVSESSHDKAYVVDLETGEQTELCEAGGQYVLGDGAFNPRRNLLLLPDATVDGEGKPLAGVRRFERGDDGSFSELELLDIDPILPPREIKPIQ